MPPGDAADTPPRFYPIGLNLTDRAVLLLGAGTVAARKVQRLVFTGCRLTVMAPTCSPIFQDSIPADVSWTWRAAPYTPSVLVEIAPTLVFACTDDPAINAQIAHDARAHGIWVNSATDGVAHGDFIVPSVLEYDPLQIALFSGGASPLFLRRLRETLTQALGPWVGHYVTLLGSVRQAVAADIADPQQRRAIYEKLLLDETILDRLQAQTIPFETLCKHVIAECQGIKAGTR